MLWTEKAREIYKDNKRFVHFCNFICYKREDKEFLRQFDIIRANYVTEIPLVHVFLTGATIDDLLTPNISEDMELLIKLFEEWDGKEE